MPTIYLISDTHVPERREEIPKEFLSQLKEDDIVLHAGDWTNAATLKLLQQKAKTFGVWGNMDDGAIRKELPEKTIVEIQGFKIGITHGFGAPEGMVEKVQSKFLEKVDMILFGHTHVPHSEEKDGILFFNPGSLSFNTDRRELTYAILEIKDNELAPRLITLDL
ncbi:MAG: metallophosphoesterase [candidate division Zixibacteria bacterium]|nr:metallophosphoesterase [candidate division Zixibacteria bacterium]